MAKRGTRRSNDKTELRAPTQSRSRESMEALLDIGRRLIEQRGIDDCSMSDVAEAAGSSIGSLYFRFGNREGFINEVMQRQIQAGRDDLTRVIAELNASARTPDQVIAGITNWIVHIFAQNQGLLRAQLRRTLESPQVWRPFQEFGARIVDETIALLEPFGSVTAEPDWRWHVRVALQIVFGTLNNILINHPGPLQLDDGRTAEELGKAAIRYLRLDGTEPRRRQQGSRRP